MAASSNFLKLRSGDDERGTRTQDNISGTLAPIATALNATPIMGAPAPPWIPPDLKADFVNYAQGYAIAGYHRDALGYVWGKGKVTSATGQVAGTVMFTLDAGYRPDLILTFAVEGSGAFQSIRIAPNGQVTTTLNVGAGGSVDLDFRFLAEQ